MRYVDDQILCIPTKQTEYILEIFNGFYPRLLFSVEKDNNKSIKFSDIPVYYNVDRIILTKWYTKNGLDHALITTCWFHKVQKN